MYVIYNHNNGRRPDVFLKTWRAAWAPIEPRYASVSVWLIPGTYGED